MRVTIKSFVPPNESIEGFHLGEPLTMDLVDDVTVGDVIQRIFAKYMKQIGIIAVNGKIAYETTALSEGDRIDLYPLLEGG